MKKDDGYVTTIFCGECGQSRLAACGVANAENLILDGWKSKGSKLICPECAAKMEGKEIQDLSSEAHTEGMIVMEMFKNFWKRGR